MKNQAPSTDWIFHQLTPRELELQVLPKMEVARYQWSEEMVQEYISKSKEMVQKIVDDSTTQVGLLEKILDLAIDSLFLKSGIVSMYENIKVCVQDKNYQTLDDMSFSDFILFLLKMVKQKETLGLLLSWIQVPLPIYLKVDEQPVLMIELLKDIMSSKNFSLILNCGSKQVKKEDRIRFIFNLFSLVDDYQYEESERYQDEVYVHVMFPGNDKKLLVDFNGSFDNIPLSFQEKSGLIIIHILQSELIKGGKFIGEEYFKKYEKLLSDPEKIIILIREAKQLDVQKVVDALGNFKDKSLVFCIPSATKKTNSIYVQVAQKIQKNNFLQLTKAISYYDILNDPIKKSEIKKVHQKSQALVKMLTPANNINVQGDKENLIEKFFPHLYLSNQLTLLKANLQEKESNSNVIDQKVEIQLRNERIQIKKRIITIEAKLKNSSALTQFVKKGFEILTNGINNQEEIKIFSGYLSSWSKQIMAPLHKEYTIIINQVQKLPDHEIKKIEMLKNEADFIQEKIDSYDISVTTVLNDMITKLSYKDTKNENESQKKDREKNQVIFETFYNISYRSMFPINLVDGKNLIFGNKYLKDFCKALSSTKKFTNKKIFVISVIGAQSSGKSTLLNYLFRCQFSTAPGRCTKGMYFNICEFDDKIIWLIDTEGLLSLSAKHQFFDNRIATFVLSISNLIIINNKGELNTQMRDMLQICTFAIKYLKKENKIHTQRPKKLMFVLRDQCMPKKDEKFQEQMVSKIKVEFNNLKKNLDLDYQQYLDFTDQDIISFPSIFTEGIVKYKSLGTLEAYGETFGQCIIGMRSRIMRVLDKEVGKNSILECYNQAESCWEAILKCGSDLMNYKTMAELIEKQQIKNVYYKLLPQFNDYLIGSFNTKIKSIKSLEQVEKLIQNQLMKVQDQFYHLKTKLREKCTCNQQEWYEDCYKKILVLCLAFENDFMSFLHKKKMEFRLDQSQSQMKISIDNDLKKLLVSSKSQKQIKEYLQQLKISILSQYDKALQKFLDNSAGFELEFAFALRQSFSSEKTSSPGTKWLADFKQLKKDQIYSSKYQNTKINLQPSQNNDTKIEELQKIIFESLFDQIKNNCESSQIILNLQKIRDITEKAAQLQEVLIKAYKEAQQRLVKLRPSKDIILKSYENVKDVLRGCLIFNAAQVYTAIGKKQIELKKQKSSEYIQNYFKKVEDAFKNKDNITKSIQNWINQIIGFYQEKLKANCYQQIQIHFNKQKNNYDQQKVRKMAKLRSLQNESHSKKKWIECYKMIVNPNKYFYEILCQEHFIKNRREKCFEVLQEQRKSVKNLFQSQFVSTLQKSVKETQPATKQQNAKRVINEFKERYKMFIQTFKQQDILLCLSNLLTSSQFKQAQIELIQTFVTVHELNIFSEKFIEQTVRKDVIGCAATCPFCGVKCESKEITNHDHLVSHEEHLFSCFRGSAWKGVRTPSYLICGTMDQLRRQCVVYNSLTPLQYIKKEYKQWYYYFNAFPCNHTPKNQEKLHQIWINISQVLKNHRYTYMKDDPLHFSKYKSYLNSPLDDSDVTSSSFIDFEGKSYSLSKY